MKRQSFLRGILAAGIAPWAAAAHAQADRLRIGLTAVILADQAAFLTRWADYLSGRLQTRVSFVTRDEYQPLHDLLSGGQIDALWTCGYPYVRFQSQLRLLAVPLYQGRPTYQSYLIHPKGDGSVRGWADLRGKTVVLEWFNPDCPFVKASHSKGSLKDAAKRNAAKGVVWLGVNSAASGKQGFSPERVAEGKKAFGLEHPILADTTGQVGKLYGATNTPHMYVIDAKGTLVYKGAIDNSPDGEGDSPTGGKLINYVDAALDDLAAGRPVATPDTKAYGCGVKYGS